MAETTNQGKPSSPPIDSLLKCTPQSHDHVGRSGDCTNATDGADGDWDGQSDLPKITAEEEEIEIRALSKEERLLAFADLYGRKSSNDLETYHHLEAFDREMMRLPLEGKAALHRGYSVKQACLFLDIENNDAKRAVERMARYWNKRFELYGDEAFEEHVLRRSPEDYHRVYRMAMEAATDSLVDEETKCWAEKFIGGWNRSYLLCLDRELANIPSQEKYALVEAAKTRPDIAASEQHKLLFLRSEDFDEKRASWRMVNYWASKFDIFGREGALRPCTAKDLLREHALELSLGFCWKIRGTDTYGRALLFNSPGNALASLMSKQGCTENGLLKICWYMLHALLEEEKSCAENGIVLLIHRRNTFFSSSVWKFTSRLISLWRYSFPVKIQAIHIFPKSGVPYFRTVLPFIKWLMGKRMRTRLLVHTGTDEKIVSDLEDCGISRDLIPTLLGGELDIDSVGRAWLQQRREAGQ